MNNSFFVPAYLDIVHKTGDLCIRLGASKICNLSGKPFDENQQFSEFGLTPMKILVELYKRYQGLDGWYLVDMRSKEYYFCGSTAQDVQEKLYELGINHRA